MSERNLLNYLEEAPQPVAAPSGVEFPHALAALSTVPGIGFKSLKRLSTACGGDLGQVCNLSGSELLDRFGTCRVSNLQRLADSLDCNRDSLLKLGRDRVAAWEANDIKIIPPGELPEQLKLAEPEPPQWLFVRGNKSLLYQHPAVAVVGTRDPTRDGLFATTTLIRYLAVYPVTIVSGLAEGIDHQAHLTSLDLNLPNVAFLGHGINVVFPLATVEARDRILAEGGLLASEYLPDDHYQKAFFVERNRLQAALADLVIPVEAKVNGGTAHTLRYAQRYQKLVMGIRFAGANGILDSIKSSGGLVFDMQSAEGQKLVDRTVRSLVVQFGKDSYPFKQLEHSFVKMIQEQEAAPDEIKRLLKHLQLRLLGE